MLSCGDIRSVYEMITPHIRRTPVIDVDVSDFGISAAGLTLKLESLQHAGSFKTRGAFANLLARPAPSAGVVAASGGNHGAAVAFAAMKRKVPAKIFVPSVASSAKIRQIIEYGAELVIAGERYADALAASEAWVVQSEATLSCGSEQQRSLRRRKELDIPPVKARGLGAVSQHTGSLPTTAAFDIANLPYPLEMAKSATNIPGSEQRVQPTFASADP